MLFAGKATMAASSTKFLYYIRSTVTGIHGYKINGLQREWLCYLLNILLFKNRHRARGIVCSRCVFAQQTSTIMGAKYTEYTCHIYIAAS